MNILQNPRKMITKFSTEDYSLITILLLLLLFGLIDYWIVFFIGLFSGGTTLGYSIAIVLCLLINGYIFLWDKIYIVTEGAFLITRRINLLLSKKIVTRGCQEIDKNRVHHVIIDVIGDMMHYSKVIVVQLQIEQTKELIGFSILRDKNYQILITFLKFLNDESISYKFTTSTPKLKKILQEHGV